MSCEAVLSTNFRYIRKHPALSGCCVRVVYPSHFGWGNDHSTPHRPRICTFELCRLGATHTCPQPSHNLLLSLCPTPNLFLKNFGVGSSTLRYMHLVVEDSALSRALDSGKGGGCSWSVEGGGCRSGDVLGLRLRGGPQAWAMQDVAVTVFQHLPSHSRRKLGALTASPPFCHANPSGETSSGQTHSSGCSAMPPEQSTRVVSTEP